MPRYIDAEALNAYIESAECNSVGKALQAIDNAPTISPDEVRGKWLITDAYPHRVYCSVCYKTYLPNADWELWSDGRIPRNFCPHCGARMTEVSEDA